MQRDTEVTAAKDTKFNGADQGKHGLKTIHKQSKRTMDEIKEWQALNYRTKVCGYLMLCERSFSYNEESGLIFTAPDFFVEKMKRSLCLSYGCTNINIIEIK